MCCEAAWHVEEIGYLVGSREGLQGDPVPSRIPDRAREDPGGDASKLSDSSRRVTVEIQQ